MILLILVTLIVTVVYYFVKLSYQYWEKRGVKGPKPAFGIGSLGKSVIFLESLGKVYTDIYKKYQNEEMVGIYRGTTPVLLLRDPDLIKEITVKSFSSFHDNDVYLNKERDPILGRNPFMLKGEEWKTVRAQLTPGFTSGKMKWLYPFLEEVSKNLVKFIESKPEMSNGQGYEAKELCIRFTLNNVGSCAFGLEGKCFEEENSEFRQLSRDFFAPDGWAVFAFSLVFLFPSIAKYLPLKAIPSKVENQLVNMVTETLEYRQKNGIIRNDFLHIMNELKKTCKDYIFTDVDVTAHAASFFGDGSETSSIVMSFTLYEIAANPEVQDLLREEIEAAFKENNDTLPYEKLQELQYLDAVIDESLRLHPPVLFIQKVCTQSFTYTPKNSNKPLVIEKDTPIILPIYALHKDPKYFDDPNSFKPERFLPHNKDNLTKYTYLPFGEGPRACLGKRFGILQIKIGIAYIIKNFKISVNKKTKVPIKYTKSPLTLAEGGLWLNFEKI